MFKVPGWPPDVPEPLLHAAPKRQIAAMQDNVAPRGGNRWSDMHVRPGLDACGLPNRIFDLDIYWRIVRSFLPSKQ